MRAILALGDSQTVTAAYTARALGLRYNAPNVVEKLPQQAAPARNIARGGLPVPAFFSFRREGFAG